MSEHSPDPASGELPRAYADLLQKAAVVAARAVDRIHDLHDQYPAAVPAPVMDQLDRAHANPAAERRGAIRLPSGTAAVSVTLAGGRAMDATVVDRSPGGLALRVPAFLLPGAVVS